MHEQSGLAFLSLFFPHNLVIQTVDIYFFQLPHNITVIPPPVPFIPLNITVQVTTYNRFSRTDLFSVQLQIFP